MASTSFENAAKIKQTQITVEQKLNCFVQAYGFYPYQARRIIESAKNMTQKQMPNFVSQWDKNEDQAHMRAVPVLWESFVKPAAVKYINENVQGHWAHEILAVRTPMQPESNDKPELLKTLHDQRLGYTIK